MKKNLLFLILATSYVSLNAAQNGLDEHGNPRPSIKAQRKAAQQAIKDARREARNNRELNLGGVAMRRLDFNQPFGPIEQEREVRRNQVALFLAQQAAHVAQEAANQENIAYKINKLYLNNNNSFDRQNN